MKFLFFYTHGYHKFYITKRYFAGLKPFSVASNAVLQSESGMRVSGGGTRAPAASRSAR